MVVPFFLFLLPRVPGRPGLRRALMDPALAVVAAGLVSLPSMTVGWFYLR